MNDDVADPFILTLRFDEVSFALFDAERRRHFPSARNRIPAHLTLFHKLPADGERQIRSDLAEIAAAAAGPLPLSIEGLRFLGYGTAYTVRSPALDAVRAELARRWANWLTPQDAQRFSGHVTIQNKAPAAEAKALFAQLRTDFQPFEADGTGLLLWRYRGGPWDAAGAFDFAAP